MTDDKLKRIQELSQQIEDAKVRRAELQGKLNALDRELRRLMQNRDTLRGPVEFRSNKPGTAYWGG